MVPFAMAMPFLCVNPAFAMSTSAVVGQGAMAAQGGIFGSLFYSLSSILQNTFNVSFANSAGLTIMLFALGMKVIEFPFYYLAERSKNKWRQETKNHTKWLLDNSSTF